MKILGKSGDPNYPTFIVELDYSEVRDITGLTARDIRSTEIAVCDTFKTGVNVLRAVGDAMKLPNALRSVADCLDMAMPAAKAIADGKKLPEDPPQGKQNP